MEVKGDMYVSASAYIFRNAPFTLNSLLLALTLSYSHAETKTLRDNSQNV